MPLCIYRQSTIVHGVTIINYTYGKLLTCFTNVLTYVEPSGTEDLKWLFKHTLTTTHTEQIYERVCYSHLHICRCTLLLPAGFDLQQLFEYLPEI